MPYENEHACRLHDPNEFKSDSFRRSTREYKGKEYSVIQAKNKGESTMTDQAFRYDKETWTASEARSHCSSHGGEFEAAKKSAGDSQRRDAMDLQTGYKAKKLVVAGEVKEVNKEKKEIVGWATQRVVDREGEIVNTKAWDFKTYEKNPRLMFAHDITGTSVGSVLWLKNEEKGLKFKARFANTDFANELWTLYKDGDMNAFSINFIPEEWQDIPNPTGKGAKLVREYTKAEMIEISCVSIPMCPEALLIAVESGKLKSKAFKDEYDRLIMARKSLQDSEAHIKEFGEAPGEIIVTSVGLQEGIKAPEVKAIEEPLAKEEVIDPTVGKEKTVDPTVGKEKIVSPDPTDVKEKMLSIEGDLSVGDIFGIVEECFGGANRKELPFNPPLFQQDEAGNSVGPDYLWTGVYDLYPTKYPSGKAIIVALSGKREVAMGSEQYSNREERELYQCSYKIDAERKAVIIGDLVRVEAGYRPKGWSKELISMSIMENLSKLKEVSSPVEQKVESIKVEPENQTQPASEKPVIDSAAPSAQPTNTEVVPKTEPVVEEENLIDLEEIDLGEEEEVEEASTEDIKSTISNLFTEFKDSLFTEMDAMIEQKLEARKGKIF